MAPKLLISFRTTYKHKQVLQFSIYQNKISKQYYEYDTYYESCLYQLIVKHRGIVKRQESALIAFNCACKFVDRNILLFLK